MSSAARVQVVPEFSASFLRGGGCSEKNTERYSLRGRSSGSGSLRRRAARGGGGKKRMETFLSFLHTKKKNCARFGSIYTDK